jgi:bacteriorhodopsin
MIDPMQAMVTMALKTSSSLLIPTSTPTSVAPIPTVKPTPPTYESVAATGSSTLWVVFVIMLFSTLAFTVMAYRTPVQKRLFPVLTAFITLTATLSYFAMATGDGNSYTEIIVREEHSGDIPTTVVHVFRQIFWARYVDWTITTPLLLLDLSFLAGLNGANIMVAVVADIVMCLTGLFAAFGHNEGQKWGYYAMGCIAYLFIIYLLAIPGRKAVSAKSNATRTLFGSIALYTLVLWTLYPVIWGFGDGSRILSVDSEILAYAVLDVLAKPVFGFWLLISHGQIGGASLEGWWAHGLAAEGNIRIDDDEGA